MSLSNISSTNGVGPHHPPLPNESINSMRSIGHTFKKTIKENLDIRKTVLNKVSSSQSQPQYSTQTNQQIN